ncbi:hypothetical protein LCGC14_1101840, partial [marine sediment metagenome]
MPYGHRSGPVGPRGSFTGCGPRDGLGDALGPYNRLLRARPCPWPARWRWTGKNPDELVLPSVKTVSE